jgi:uncharacterized membrane protein
MPAQKQVARDIFMTLYCPQCGGALDVDPAHMAAVVRCPHCGGEFRPSDRRPAAASPALPLPVSVGACLNEGWRAFTTYPGPLIGGWLLYVIIMAAISAVPCAGVIAGIVLAGPMTAGFSRFGDCLVGYALISTFVALGFLCLIVPGVVLALMFYLTYYLILDRQMPAWDAITTSSRMMRGHKLTVFGLWVLLALINLLGLLALGLGLLVTVPLSSCASAAVYRRINGA